MRTSVENDVEEVTASSDVKFREIAEAISTARQRSGKKQTEVAHHLSCRDAFISKLEKGVTLPPLDKAVRLEQFLDLPTGTLTDLVIKARIQYHTIQILREARRVGGEVKVQFGMKVDWSALPTRPRTI